MAGEAEKGEPNASVGPECRVSSCSPSSGDIALDRGRSLLPHRAGAAVTDGTDDAAGDTTTGSAGGLRLQVIHLFVDNDRSTDHTVGAGSHGDIVHDDALISSAIGACLQI